MSDFKNTAEYSALIKIRYSCEIVRKLQEMLNCNKDLVIPTVKELLSESRRHIIANNKRSQK